MVFVTHRIDTNTIGYVAKEMAIIRLLTIMVFKATNLSFAFLGLCCFLTAQPAPPTVGLFDGYGDVGIVLHPGSAEYDAAKRTYSLTGSGENMWATSDAFQFAWKRVSGDVAGSA